MQGAYRSFLYCLYHGPIVCGEGTASPFCARHQQCGIKPWVGPGPEIEICILGDVPGKGPSRESYIIS